jgi:drug/metabolite transporter (DMT)-like permease
MALGAARPVSVLMTRMMLMRLFAAGAATTFIVISLRYVPLATVNTVLQATPLLVTAGAAIFYGEKVGLPRWMAALVGFAGVLLIVKPGNAQMGTAAFIVIIALAFTTMRDLTTRGLEQTIPSIYVAAASAVVITLSGFLVAPFDTPWTMPAAGAWGWMYVAIRRLPVHCHNLHRHRVAHGRDRGRCALSLCRRTAFRRAWILVVGRHAGHPGVCRHWTGRRCRPLHFAP